MSTGIHVDPSSGACVFCQPAEVVFLRTALTLARWCNFPVSPGHALVVPVRHVESWFDLTPTEHQAVTEATRRVYAILRRRHAPDGFNLGVNVGTAAGQTVMHAHLHVIPRYHGDVPDPRGGVRNVLPRGNYLQSSEERK